MVNLQKTSIHSLEVCPFLEIQFFLHDVNEIATNKRRNKENIVALVLFGMNRILFFVPLMVTYWTKACIL